MSVTKESPVYIYANVAGKDKDDSLRQALAKSFKHGIPPIINESVFSVLISIVSVHLLLAQKRNILIYVSLFTN